ncbi:MAG: hypothetical protein ACFFHV_20000 [Promethearchaeota archaeon]
MDSLKLASNEKLAEMIGIFYGAGIIERSQLIISIEKTRKQYIDHISDLIECVIKVKPRKELNGSEVKLIISSPEAISIFKVSCRQNGIANCFYLLV